MALYYFHQMDGEEILDPEGIDLPDLEAVRHEAIRGAREILGEDLRNGMFDLRWRFEIVDEVGRLVMVVPFSDAVDLSRISPRRKDA
jgi:hypothetical protein